MKSLHLHTLLVFLIIHTCCNARDSIHTIPSDTLKAKLAKDFKDAKEPETEMADFIFKTKQEESLTIMFLTFSLIVLSLTSWLIYKYETDFHIAFKYFIIILLVLGMLMLIVIGYSQNQISPAVGLFGTIAAYLLGRTEKTS
jgi:hypothetical protein